ncbi:polysaccharide deacetylase family protein [Nocardioides korecus]
MSVLCYHALDAAWDSPLSVSPEDFDDQCQVLARSGRVVRTASAPAARDHAITFDDGFASVFEHGLPVLRRLQLPATVFVVAGTLERPASPVDWVFPPVDPAPGVLTADQVLELAESGVEIGSHTWSHRDLPDFSEAECLDDLRSSRTLLEDLLGRRVAQLAYPFGHHAAHVRRAAQRAGYDLAYSLPDRREPVGPYAVPRVGVYRGNDLRTFRLKLARPYLRLRMSRAYARWWPEPPPVTE